MRRDAVPADLLTDVKTCLQISWTDGATDARIRGVIASGTDYLDAIAGEPMNYLVDGDARTLLMEYARYARDAALDVFENNYRHLLLALQEKMRIKRYVEETGETGSYDQCDV